MTFDELEQFRKIRGQSPSRIKLRQLLTRGIVSDLWIASHESLPFEFLVKYTKETAQDNPYLMGQYEREYEASETLIANGVQSYSSAVIDCDVDSIGHAYTFVEYVHGTELGMIMQTMHDWCDVRVLLMKLCAALTAIHAAGIIHRDIKPSNILVDSEGNVRIIDLALATIDGQWQKYQKEGLAIGTPLYMSPAQAFGEKRLLTSASDWYSVGIILYEWMSGDVPFRGSTAEETLRMHCYTPAQCPINHHIVGAPDCLPEICLALLCKDPNARVAAVRQFKYFLHANRPH